MFQTRDVLIAGGTGYIGQRLAVRLASRGHRVRVLTRASSASRVPVGVETVVGDALHRDAYAASARAGDTVVHLVGTPHPSPSKAAAFERVDAPSIRAAVHAARVASVAHLIYVSVAHPAPVMHAYIAVRAAGESRIADARLTATVLRPWYVLGPGHRWPIVLKPLYAIAARVPSLRAGAERLGLVTIEQMVGALIRAVEDPPRAGSIRVLDVPAIRERQPHTTIAE